MFINQYLQQMKETQPEEYAKLMKGYSSEEELMEDVLCVTDLAIKDYKRIHSGGTEKWEKKNLFKKHLEH